MAVDPAAALAHHRATRQAITDRLVAFLVTEWDALGSWDRADVARYLARVSPVIDGATFATVAHSSAFYAALLDTAPVAATPAVPPPAVRDAFTAFWHALGEERAFDDALGVGRSTLDAAGSNHVTSAARLTGDAVAEASGRTVRWRRQASATACDWCRARDGGIYLSAADADYGHDRCHCVPVPITDW